ncbi:hypothetical protein PMAYCL1PPCAC_16394, partial [Pristionchus mayeri]
PLDMSLPGMPLATTSSSSSPLPFSPSLPSSSPAHSSNSAFTSSSTSASPVRVSPAASSLTPQRRDRCASLDFGPGGRMQLTARTGPQPTRMPLGTRHSDTPQTTSRRRRVSIDENYETTAQFIEQMRKELIKQL